MTSGAIVRSLEGTKSETVSYGDIIAFPREVHMLSQPGRPSLKRRDNRQGAVKAEPGSTGLGLGPTRHVSQSHI